MKVSFRFLLFRRLHKFLQVVGMYGSTLLLLATAFDRYQAIKDPMKSYRKPPKRVHFVVTALWLTAAVLAIPQASSLINKKSLLFWQFYRQVA